jgi:hypothetical protein
MIGGLVTGFCFCVVFCLACCFSWKMFSRACSQSVKNNKIGPMDLRVTKEGEEDDAELPGRKGYQENTTITQSHSQFSELDARSDAPPPRIHEKIYEESDSEEDEEEQYPMPKQNARASRPAPPPNGKPFKPLDGVEARTRSSNPPAANGRRADSYKTMDFR